MPVGKYMKSSVGFMYPQPRPFRVLCIRHTDSRTTKHSRWEELLLAFSLSFSWLNILSKTKFFYNCFSLFLKCKSVWRMNKKDRKYRYTVSLNAVVELLSSLQIWYSYIPTFCCQESVMSCMASPERMMCMKVKGPIACLAPWSRYA